MKNFIIIAIFTLGILIPIIAFAGQEKECYHDDFLLKYNSNKEVLQIYCKDCGETMHYDIDSDFVRQIFWK